MMKLAQTSLLLLLLSGAACRHSESEKSQVKEFAPVPTEVDEEWNWDNLVEVTEPYKLTRLPEIDLNMRRYLPKMSDELKGDDQTHPEDHTFYSFDFGTLSPEEFKQLKSTYYNDPGIVYEKNRAYNLVDFMPPQIQAMYSLRFISERKDAWPLDGSEIKLNFQLLTNCWNMAFNFIRGGSAFTQLFYIDGVNIDKVLTDPKYSTSQKTFVIKESDKWGDAAAIAERDLGLEPFDVILIRNGKDLLHTAIYIDRDLYFEKTSPQDEVNYRFTPFSNIATTYLEGQGHFRQLDIEVRRYKEASMPKAEDILSLKARSVTLSPKVFPSEFLSAYPNISERVAEMRGSQLYVIANVPLSRNAKTQRYEIAESAYKSVLSTFTPAKR